MVNDLKQLWLCLIGGLLLAAFALAVDHTPVWAQSPSPDALKLYTKLYCPLCGGVRLDACQLQVCEEMRAEIQQKLAAGQTDDQIIQYYRVRWGDQVLGYPPAEGINLFPWLVPIVLVGGGGIVLWRMARGWTRARSHAALASAPRNSVSPDVAARVDRELYE
jgi:cytochrome c-type biogenesis protein CcmH